MIGDKFMEKVVTEEGTSTKRAGDKNRVVLAYGFSPTRNRVYSTSSSFSRRQTSLYVRDGIEFSPYQQG